VPFESDLSKHGLRARVDLRNEVSIHGPEIDEIIVPLLDFLLKVGNQLKQTAQADHLLRYIGSIKTVNAVGSKDSTLERLHRRLYHVLLSPSSLISDHNKVIPLAEDTNLLQVVWHDNLLQIVHHLLAVTLAHPMEVKVIILNVLLAYAPFVVQSFSHIMQLLFKTMVWLDETEIDNSTIVVFGTERVKMLHHRRQRHFVRLVYNHFESTIL
jgi:hypothetical protein